MEIGIEEHKLLVDYHRLPAEGRQELLVYLRLLLNKYGQEDGPGAPAANQCELGKRREARPEAADEPIFTE